MKSLVDTTQKQIVAVGIALVVLLAGIVGVLAAGGGGDEVAAQQPSTTTTTAAPTTTTVPPPPPVYPLTGLPQLDPGVAARPALVVKIENADAGGHTARPQQGITQADVVYEETVEGSITRFLSVFHSTDANGRVGPVRSFRSTDVGLVSPLNRPLYAWSGANADWVQLARSMPAADVGYDAAPHAYHRDGGRRAPHNLFSSTQELWSMTPAGSGPPPALWPFRAAGEPLPAGSAPAGALAITYGSGAGSAPVEWHWDPAQGAWLRFQRGTPHLDEDGVQVAAQNVIVQHVDYIDSGYVDSSGSTVIEAQLVGGGEAWLLTAGSIVRGSWTKPAPEAPTQFLDAAGQPMRLTPGRTWVALPWAGVAAVSVG